MNNEDGQNFRDVVDNELLHEEDDVVELFATRVARMDNDLYGKVVFNEEEAYNLYNKYALELGFSVRRGKYRHCAATGNIIQREFVCSKEGFQRDEKLDEVKKGNRLVTRTGCKAFIRFSIENETWKVTKFQPAHNHDLALPSERHMLKSGRKISAAKAGVIDTMKNAGVRTKYVYSYLSKEHGGSENVGFSQRDCYNYVDKQKMMKIEAGDAQSLMNYFKKKKVEDPMFFYAVQVDQKNRLTNFFWRDGRSRMDYDCFGDVMVFDTTYRTNKYNLICGPFVGVNHHWQNTIFGCAFLLDETAASFKWLFEAFLESMGGKEPVTLFTDQDAAMAKAIKEVFSTTRHRLCLWHISKNAPSYFGDLNGDSKFQALWNRCCRGCESEVEFQETWDKMNDIYDISSHSWLNGMYAIRSKWSTVFNQECLSAGILSSQRSESTNNMLNGIAGKTTYLTQFTLHFDNLVGHLRSRELQEDFRCKQGTPTLLVKHSGILEHAAKVYTSTMYIVFQNEFLSSLATTWRELSANGSAYTYEVKEEGHSRLRTVKFNAEDNTVMCSCKKFEVKGMLCCHALKILNVRNITTLPDDYILKRWTKEAKKGMMGREKELVCNKTKEDVEIVWRNSMMRLAGDIIYRSQQVESIRKICQEGLLELEKTLEGELEKVSSATSSNFDNEGDQVLPEHQNPMLDPPQVKTKGMKSARVKGHFEKRKPKSSTKVSQRKKLQTYTRPEDTSLQASQPIQTSQGTTIPSHSFMNLIRNVSVENVMTSHPQGTSIQSHPFTNLMPNVVPLAHPNQSAYFYSENPMWQLYYQNQNP